MPQRTVSVIVPNYNRHALLRGSLQSLLAQTCPPDQILVVDDGSTDGSDREAEAILAGVPGAMVIRQANAGAAAARNAGMAHARGDWIGFLDSDDQWDPTRLARFHAMADARPTLEMAHCERRYVEGGMVLRASGGFDPKTMEDGAAMLGRFCIKTSTVLLHRALLDRTGRAFATDLVTCEDYELFWRAAAIARDIGFDAAPLVTISETLGSLTRRANKVPMARDNLEAGARVARWLRDRGHFDAAATMDRCLYRFAQDLILRSRQQGLHEVAAAIGFLRGRTPPARLVRAVVSSLVSRPPGAVRQA
jgi:glycosyltransferase involved in cell wall biosynthesis